MRQGSAALAPSHAIRYSCNSAQRAANAAVLAAKIREPGQTVTVRQRHYAVNDIEARGLADGPRPAEEEVP
jgi:hypothetical protein